MLEELVNDLIGAGGHEWGKTEGTHHLQSVAACNGGGAERSDQAPLGALKLA